MVESAQWTDAENTVARAVIDGVGWHGIRMDEQGELQRQVQDWIDADNAPTPYDPAKDPMRSSPLPKI